MTAHAAGQLSSNESATLIDLDRVLAATERILDAALHFQQIAFAHACVCVLSLAEVGGKLAQHFKYRNKRPIFTESKDISLNFAGVPSGVSGRGRAWSAEFPSN